MKDKYDVFISYRRNGGEHTAKIINDSLTALGYKVFFDVEALRSGAFNTKLLDVIEHCRDVIVVLSENSLERCASEDDWVRKEISFALKQNKNIVPVLLRNFSFPKEMPEDIEPLRWKNGVEASTEFYDAFVKKLQSFLTAKQIFYKRILKQKYLQGVAIAMLTVFIAATLVIAGVNKLSTNQFPDSAAEKNIVSEALYCTSKNAALLNETFEIYQDSIETCRKYICNNAGVTFENVEEKLYYASGRLPKLSTEFSAPTEDLISRMSDTPMPVADFKALYDQNVSMCDEMNDNIEFVCWLIQNESFTTTTKDQYLGLMLEYAELEAQFYYYFINSVFIKCESNCRSVSDRRKS